MYQTLIKPFLADAKTFVLDTLFPIRCLRCGDESAFVCAKCLPMLTRLQHQYCIVCQKPSIMGFTHPGCQTPHAADGLISVLNYHDETVADIIIKGKYKFLPGVYQELGKFLADQIKVGYPLLATGYQLVPLPLHKRRLRWRGFNQTDILCRAIGAELNLPIASVLVRCKNTKTQKDLKREQRIKNVRDAFALNPQFAIRNKQFLLIDDVTTTGATLLEAAQILKRNGASKVWCLTVARD